MKYLSISTVALYSIVLSSPAIASITTLGNAFDRFNVVTLGNYELRNETEGAAYVGGDYNPASGARQFAFNSGGVADDSTNVLFLNNGVTGSQTTTLASGSVVSRVTVTSNLFNLNGNGQGNPSISTGEAAFQTALNQDLGVNTAADFATDILNASSQLSSLPSNSTATASNGGALVFDASGATSNIAVFNVTDNDFSNSSNGDRLEISNAANDVTIIINVSGTDITITDSFSNGFTNNESNIILNFFEATSITISNNVRGSILAPLASVTQNANIDGDIVVQNLVQNSEVHNVGFENLIPVPEPSSILSLALGSCLLFRRKRTA